MWRNRWCLARLSPALEQSLVSNSLQCVGGTHASVRGSGWWAGWSDGWMDGQCWGVEGKSFLDRCRKGTSQLTLPLDAIAVISLRFILPSSQDFFLFLLGKGYFCNFLRSIPPSSPKVLCQHKYDWETRADSGRNVNKAKELAWMWLPVYSL